MLLNSMKRFLILTAFICIQLISYSQERLKCWNLTIYDDDFSPEHLNPTWTYYGLKTGGDTIISGILYKKLFISYDSLFRETFGIVGIREDSNRIYLSESIYTPEEALLYDFSLDSGDSITVYRLFRIDHPSMNQALAIVDSISTIQIDGAARKQLFVEYQCIGCPECIEKDTWVEGIGSLNFGLLNESCWCVTGCYEDSYLTCYSENNSTIWRNPLFTSCYIDSNATMNTEAEIIREDVVSITVVDKRVQIQSEVPISSLRLINLQGQTIFIKDDILANFFDLDLQDQDNGLYVIIVNNRYIQKALLF
jgi:hypothetical protein